MLGGTGVPGDRMNVARFLIKRLSRRQGPSLASADLHHDGALQDIDECLGIVTMNRIGAPGRILHEEHQCLLARNVPKLLRHERGHHGVGSSKAR